MSEFHFEVEETVLLVGEGNFSFCYSLLQYLKNSSTLFFTNLYATCLEEEHLSIIPTEIKSYLEHSGVNLIFAVDATKLSKHPLLRKLSFNKIIFNFPHVGGKMKIHLNRHLLEDFFLDSSTLLAKAGEVIVTLCAGQGGTPFEKICRRLDDTWQIVEMAARSGLVLQRTKYFPAELFRAYVSTGYRGGIKSFNTRNATIHYFRRGLPLIKVDDEMDKNMIWHLYEGVLVPYSQKKKLISSPYLDPNSPQSLFVKILEELCRTADKDYVYLSKCETTLFTKCPMYSHQAHCIVAGKVCYLRKNLLDSVSKSNNGKHYIVKGLCFNQLYGDFKKAAAECHVAVFGPRRDEICGNFISRICHLFQSSFFGKSEEKLLNLTTNNWYQLKDDDREGIDINIDEILVNIFSVNWRQLWAQGVTLKMDDNHPLIIPPSIYFQTFSFDTSFLSRSDPLDIKKLLTLVQQISCDLIESSYLLNIYMPQANSFRKIYCIRFVYNSYASALSRQSALVYHKFIGKAIEQYLPVEIV